MKAALLLPCLLLAVAAGPVRAAEPATTTAPALPAWDQLTPAQRELLIAPLRERWNGNPDMRGRMYAHAQRWQQMTPEQRKRAHHGLQRWEHMDPEQRRAMRALFQKMRSMTPEQREALRKRWHAMSEAERRAWVVANAPED